VTNPHSDTHSHLFAGATQLGACLKGHSKSSNAVRAPDTADTAVKMLFMQCLVHAWHVR
jgi:hypothetical protein